jgi:hypothetical protein
MMLTEPEVILSAAKNLAVSYALVSRTGVFANPAAEIPFDHAELEGMLESQTVLRMTFRFTKEKRSQEMS